MGKRKSSRRNAEFRLENLVVLQTVPRTQCDYGLKIVDWARANATRSGRLSVDLNQGTWSYMTFQNIPIGDSIDDENAKIIGVYDRTNLQHLISLINDSIGTADFVRAPYF